MFLTPEIIVLALVFQFFRACGTLFFQNLFYKREKAPATAPMIKRAARADNNSRTKADLERFILGIQLTAAPQARFLNLALLKSDFPFKRMYF